MVKKRILVVDDDESLTDMLKLHLEDTGAYEVQVQNKGAYAVEAAKQFRPDLILLDVVMPDMDGDRLAAKIKEEATLKSVPIVFLTAIVSKSETDESGGVIGNNLFISKPVSARDLIRHIEKVLVR